MVGGAERGGVIVRCGCDLSSDIADSRLATGSVVKDGSGLSFSQVPMRRLPGHGSFGSGDSAMGGSVAVVWHSARDAQGPTHGLGSLLSLLNLSVRDELNNPHTLTAVIGDF